MNPEAEAHEIVHDLQEGTHVPEAGHEGGFPPFNAHTFQSQLVWLVLCFIVLYVLMSRVALPRIAAVIEARRAKIAGDLDQAAALSQQTNDAIAAYEKALAEARGKAHEIAQQSRDLLNAEIDRQSKATEAELAEKLAAAERSIAATKDQALQNVRTVAIDVTGAIVGQLLGEEADKASVERAVDSAIKRG